MGGGGGDSISAGNLHAGPHICRKPISGIPYLQEAWMWGDPVPTGSQMRNPISARNLDGGDPISAGNLDVGGGGGSRTYSKPDVGSHTCKKPDGESHICRKPGWGIGGSHICRKPTGVGGGGDPMSSGNLDGGCGVSYLQEP